MYRFEGKLLVKFEKIIAPMKIMLTCVVDSLLDPWENIHSMISALVREGEEENRGPVCRYYEIGKKRMHSYCMILGKSCKHGEVQCAHIWPKHTMGKQLDQFGLNPLDVNRPRNFLRLHKDIERGFDRKRLIFELVSTTPFIRLKVILLDPSIRAEKFIAGDKEWTFEELSNKEFDYKFEVKRKPFLRLIAHHALRAYSKAQALGWIEADESLLMHKDNAIRLARLSLGEQSHIMKAFFNCDI
jgi:hypothetical protein